MLLIVSYVVDIQAPSVESATAPKALKQFLRFNMNVLLIFQYVNVELWPVLTLLFYFLLLPGDHQVNVWFVVAPHTNPIILVLFLNFIYWFLALYDGQFAVFAIELCHLQIPIQLNIYNNGNEETHMCFSSFPLL